MNDPKELARLVMEMLPARFCTGELWLSGAETRVLVRSAAGELGYLTVHDDGDVSYEGMRSRGPELCTQARARIQWSQALREA
jgi:hypothetical protein